MTKPEAREEQASTVPSVADFATKIWSYGEMALPEPAPKDARGLEQALAAHKQWVESVGEPARPVGGRRACLRGCDLRGANLARRELRAADFAGANLEGAVLAYANLGMANLTGANLKNADLRGAKLRGACLEGANLDGADLTGAITD